MEAPRLRRADAHPDAPARRPLLARDLGEPLDLEQFPEAPAEAEAEPIEAAPRPLPGFLVAQTPEPEPFAQDAQEPVAAEAEPQWQEPEAQWTSPEPPVAEAGPAPEAEAGELPIATLAAQLPDPAGEREDESDQSLSQLANRIEFGLSRKRQALPAAIDCAPAEETAAEQEKIGHRLRSAINDLQKIASTGG